MLGNVALSEALRWTKLSQQCFMASVYRQNTAGPDFDETSPSGVAGTSIWIVITVITKFY